MMRVALFPNPLKPKTLEVAKNICEFFQPKDVTVHAPDTIAESIGAHPLSSIEPTQLNFLISMGGDGTILKLAHEYAQFDVPIFGINLGYLGFMADVPLADLNSSLHELLEGKYEIEKRIVIHGSGHFGSHFAINDFVFHRGRNPSLVEITIHEKDRLINSFKADGVVIATPNGSTAYSLAAGGPILTPDLEAFVITPISAHTISNRPIVVASDTALTVSVSDSSEPIEVVADGLFSFELPHKQHVTLTRANRSFKLVNLNRRDYFSTLRTKLGWAGKLDPTQSSH